MSSPTSTLAGHALSRLSGAVGLNVAGLVLTSAGMLLQIGAGSTLYPSLAGPVILLGSAVIVAFGPLRWAPYVGLLVPLVLGIGAIAAAAMTGEFVDQLTDTSTPGILVGSVMHVVGLVMAVTTGGAMVVGRRAVGERGS